MLRPGTRHRRRLLQRRPRRAGGGRRRLPNAKQRRRVRGLNGSLAPQLHPRHKHELLRVLGGIHPGLCQCRLHGLCSVLLQPRVLQRLDGGRPALRIHGEHRLDKVLPLLRHDLERPGVVDGTLLVLPLDLGIAPAVHRLHGQQCVERAADRPDVGLVIVAGASQHLGRDILDGAAPLLEKLFRLDPASEAEIDEFDGISIFLHVHDVLGLQVTMHHAARVQVGSRPQHLHDHLGGFGFVKAAFLDEPVKELAAVQLLEDQVHMPFRLVHGLHSAEQRVVHGRVNINLPDNVFQLLRRRVRQVEALDRKLHTGAPADGLAHSAAHARAQHLARHVEIVFDPRATARVVWGGVAGAACAAARFRC
mmetsp:Transcript_30307/g.100563  ORF Transcript_30307/g.100563 Transcript_30307/m.100563 type:complete len:364 (+) Transcript_30307:422-1513(+)